MAKKETASVKKNFIMNAILNMSAFIFPLISFPYISRVLLPAGYGKVTAAYSLISYFAMVAQLGIPTYGIRACARVRDDRETLSKTVQEIFLINLIMSVLVYGVFFAAVFTVPALQEDRTLYIIVSATIFFNLIGMEWVYKALEQYTYITKRSILFKFIALILVFVLIHSEDDVLWYGFTYIFASVGSNLMNFINVRKHVSVKPVGHYNLKQHLKPTFVFFAMTVATTIYTHLDTVMLKFMQGDEECGYYSAAVRIKTIAVSIVTSIGTVLLPRVSYYLDKKMHAEFKRVTAKAFNLVILMSLPMVIYFICYAKETIVFLSGDAYLAAIPPMKIIMPTVFLIGLTNVMGIQILVPQGREKAVLVSEIVGAVVDLVLNILLIPRYGASGAAVGTLAAEVAVLIVQTVYLRAVLRDIAKDVRIGKILLACALAWAAARAASLLPISVNAMMLIWTALVFFGVYGIVLLVMKEPLARESVDIVLKKLKRN